MTVYLIHNAAGVGPFNYVYSFACTPTWDQICVQSMVDTSSTEKAGTPLLISDFNMCRGSTTRSVSGAVYVETNQYHFTLIRRQRISETIVGK